MPEDAQKSRSENVIMLPLVLLPRSLPNAALLWSSRIDHLYAPEKHPENETNGSFGPLCQSGHSAFDIRASARRP